MRIAIDAMGGDHAPREVVAGAVQAAVAFPQITRLFLVGDKSAVERELQAQSNRPDSIEIVHAAEIVEMDDLPAQAIRRKKDSSISRAMDLVKAGDAQAVVSAGNTGAVVVAATLKLRTLEGVERPAIAAVLPTQNRPLILVDAGANIDSSTRMLAQFAAMGTVYSRHIMKQSEPVVGLLSVGVEDVKGNEMTKEAFQVLSDSHMNFRGNVEGHDIYKGDTDVVVCDGFIGNIVLKASESAAQAIRHWLKQELTRNPWRMLGAGLLTGAFKVIKQRMDPELTGGAPLLGANGVCIITHGASSSVAIYNAIRVASESIGHQLNSHIVEEVAKLN